MLIHIRDFGKIKSADIELCELIILVGENNTGKTYLMQLIYGLLSFLYTSDSSKIYKDYSGLIISNETVVRGGDSTFYKEFNDRINSYLDEYKEDIVWNTFHSKELSIGSLSIEFGPLEEEFSVHYEGSIENNESQFIRYSIQKNGSDVLKLGFSSSIDEKLVLKIIREQFISVILLEILGLKKDSVNDTSKDVPLIYLPASRSGMVLLYANYLVDTDDNSIEKKIVEIDGNTTNVLKDNKYGLTEPVYRFLQFLLKYKPSFTVSEKNKDLLSFIERYIVEGKFEKVGNTMRYTPSEKTESIPIYLSSSLATEISPIYQILSGVSPYNMIFYDEIETCQHPTKQLQLARLLIRMVNKGYRMMVSTHSDTMAAAINNLLILAAKNKKKELLEKLDYDENDILKTKHVKAYQFVSEKDGSNVIELNGYFSSGVGFDFGIFNQTNNKVYNDAVVLAGGEV